MKNLLIIIVLILYGSHINAGINYWSYETFIDPFSDETDSIASFQTLNDGKRINVRCIKNEFHILIDFNKYIKQDGTNTLKYRIDKNSFIEDNDWKSSTDGTTVFASDKLKLKLASELINGDKIAIFRVFDDNYSSHDMTINFTSAKKLITKVMQDCNIDRAQVIQAVEKKRFEEEALELKRFRKELTQQESLDEMEDAPKEFSNFQQEVFDNLELIFEGNSKELSTIQKKLSENLDNIFEDRAIELELELIFDEMLQEESKELQEFQKTSHEILAENLSKSIEEKLSSRINLDKIDYEKLEKQIKENLSIIFD